MDDFERASHLEQEDREIALRAHAERNKTQPADECSDCDEPLDEHRKQYGICVECKTVREQRAKHHRQD